MYTPTATPIPASTLTHPHNTYQMSYTFWPKSWKITRIHLCSTMVTSLTKPIFPRLSEIQNLVGKIRVFWRLFVAVYKYYLQTPIHPITHTTTHTNTHSINYGSIMISRGAIWNCSIFNPDITTPMTPINSILSTYLGICESVQHHFGTMTRFWCVCTLRAYIFTHAMQPCIY